MEDVSKQIIQEEQEVNAKWLQRFLKEFKKPDLSPSPVFRERMEKRLHKKMREKQEEQEQLILLGIPNFVKWRFRLAGFATAVCAFLFLFVLSFFTDIFSDQLFVSSKYVQKDAKFEIQVLETAAVEKAIMAESALESPAAGGAMMRTVFSDAILLDTSALQAEEVGYLYDGKKYPKVPAEMPVYKFAGSLVNEALLAKSIWGMKFGDISLKVFKELKMNEVSFSQQSGNYMLRVNLGWGSLAIFPNDADKNWTFDASSLVPISEKELKKTVAKQLKAIGVSLVNYGEPTVVFRKVVLPEDERYLLLEYPFLLNGFPVWNTNNNRSPQSPIPLDPVRVVMSVTYDRVTGEVISLVDVDIAKYEYANYPTFSKEEILRDFNIGMKKLNAPEIVYLKKYIGDEMYYLPWLRFAIDEKQALYKELLDF